MQKNYHLFHKFYGKKTITPSDLALQVQVGAALYFLGSAITALSPCLWGIYATWRGVGLGCLAG